MDSRCSARCACALKAAARYDVEIRSLDQHANSGANSCGCIDHRVNGLGTCKHIEGVLAGLERQDAAAWTEAARNWQIA